MKEALVLSTCFFHAPDLLVFRRHAEDSSSFLKMNSCSFQTILQIASDPACFACPMCSLSPGHALGSLEPYSPSLIACPLAPTQQPPRVPSFPVSLPRTAPVLYPAAIRHGPLQPSPPLPLPNSTTQSRNPLLCHCRCRKMPFAGVPLSPIILQVGEMDQLGVQHRYV